MSSPDRPFVRTVDPSTTNRRQRAVVVGASMAGLLAARVLADHFAEVILVERDRLSDAPAFRAGVPQARHLHVLLAGGRSAVERLFPGLGSELLAAGAVPLRMPRDSLWLAPAGWSRRFDDGLDLLSSSRELLEWSVRRRLADLANVRFVDGHEVVGLVAIPDGTAVGGVRLRRRGAPASDQEGEGRGSAAQTLPAGFVVDASGRRSRAPEWLRELGWPAVAETVIDSHLGYASRQYAIPAGAGGDWKAIMLQAKPPATTRTGYLFPIEGNRWFVSLMGYAGDYPPTDEAGFLDFVGALRSPVLARAIADAEPLSPIFGHRGTENRARRFDRLPRRPDRFLVVGDAACAFNPIYGQGMAVAAKAALTLDRCLRERGAGGDLAGLAGRVQREVAKTAADAWLVATGEDLRYPTTAGATPNLQTRLTHRYLDRVVSTATHDGAVSRAFLDVVNLNASPASLFRPGVLVRLLRHGGATAPTPARLAGHRPVELAEPAEVA